MNMSCAKFFRYSKYTIQNKFKRSYLHKKSQLLLCLSSHQAPLCSSFQIEHDCNYSTTLFSRQSVHKKLKFYPTSPIVNSVLFLSGDQSNESYRVIITDPSQTPSTTEFTTSFPKSEDAANTLVESGSSVDLSSALSTPDIADAAASISSAVSQLATEPSLASLGLCNYTPVGAIQSFLEYLHMSLGIPWWAAIVACTVTVRIILIPLLVATQRNALNMSNYMPKMQYLQTKFGEARRSGNTMEATKYATELMAFMKENNIKPVKNALMPMLQAPVFLSFFLALRSMAKTPVESMKYGGIWWATDLTIPDPFYIMPILSCSTLYIVLKIGAESGVKLENMKMARYVLQALPIVALPFCINFPAAVLYYWVTSNFCTLAIVSLLKVKPLRQYLNLPTQRPVDPAYALPKKGFLAGVKESYNDQKILAAVEDRRRMDTIRFQKAGTGPIPRTYSYDPTKPRPSNVAAAASRSNSTDSTKNK